MNIRTDVVRLSLLGTLCVCALLADVHAQSAPAGRGGSDPVIFETRPPGQAGGGMSLGGASFMAHTFRLHERTEITALGLGNLGGEAGKTVFAALYQVDTPYTVPDVVGESGFLGATLVEVPPTSADAAGQISLIVEPGIYAIVAGTARHGATVESILTGIDNAGTGSTSDTWNLPYSINPATGVITLQNATPRFFIEGEVLPPSPVPPDQFLMETALPTAWWTQSSSAIQDNHWFGTRFEITRITRIEQAGSWLHMGSGQIFAAVVTLDGPDAHPLPVSHPGFAGTVMGTTLIDPGGAPRAYTGDFENLELAPGHYALLFGTGMFGAAGSAGIMGASDQIIHPGALRWIGDIHLWTDSSFSRRMFLTGVSDALSVVPDPADFGSVPIGEQGTETITITNLRDDADLQMSGIGVNGNLRFSLGPDVGDCSVAVIGPGQSCEFTVLFHPSNPGPETGILQVWSDGEPSPFVIDLTGNGIAPTIALEPGILNFEIHQGDAGSATLMVNNTGEADLDWSIMRSEATPASETRGFQDVHEGFENVSQLPAAGWVMINNSEPTGTTGWFQGGSYPAHQGPANSYVSAAYHNTQGPDGVISNWLLSPELDLSEGVRLRFRTRVPTNSCCPDRLEVRLSTSGDSTEVGDSELSTGDFGTRLLTINEGLVQGGYPEQWTEFTVTVPAQGAATGGRLAFRYFATEAGSQSLNSNWLSIDTVSITQWDGGAVCTGPAEIPWLGVSPDAGTTPPDGISDVDVTIDTAGLAEGEHSAQLCVNSNDPDNPVVTVPVELTVAPPRTPELVFDPAALDFSDVGVGATGGPISATLSNIGNADATGLNVTLTGAFGLHYNDCGNALPAGQDCEVGIVFTPAEEGAAAGTLEVTANGGHGAALPLTGNGVDTPAPALEYGPEAFSFNLFPDEIGNHELVIGNLGAGDLTWALDTDTLPASAARGHDPSLDEPFAIPDFQIDSASNGGQPAIFTLPAGKLSRGEVVGFSFTGTVTGITGTPSWAFEMCMFVTAPDGTSHAVGGRFAVPGCGVDSWDFTNNSQDDGTYSSSHDNVFDPPLQDDGAWTFTFHNAWHSTDAATMNWSDVTVTLHKRAVPCLPPSEVGWLSVNPETGTVAPTDSESVTVTADAAGLSEGSYAASLCLSSNDPETPLAVVPVSLRVETPAPEIAVAPAFFDFELLQGDSSEETLAVSNPGHADLAWDLFEPFAGTGDTLVLLEEDFEGGFLPSGWDAIDVGDLSCPWRTSDDYGLDGWNGAARGAAVDSDHCFPDDVPFDSVDASLMSPSVNLAHASNARVDFDLAYRHLGFSRLQLDISTDGGASWTTLRTWSSDYAYPDNTSLPVTADLSAYDGEPDVTLRWRYRSGWDWWVYVDNIMVSADPPETCYVPSADPWLSVDPISGTVPPDDSQSVALSIGTAELPTGLVSTDLCIHNNVPGDPLVVVPVTLNVTAPALEIDPPLLDFGEVMTGTISPAQTATLHNTGTADATGLDFTLSASVFAADSGDCDTVLPPGASCQIDVTFLPAGPGPVDALLEVSSDENAFAELELAGTGTLPGLSIAPSAADFGNVPVDETGGPLTLTLASIGGAAVTIDEIAGSEAPFALAGDDCGARPFTLPPGDKCQLDVVFTPQTVGEAAATLTITGNAPSSPDQVSLSGTGVGALLEVDPETFVFELVTGQHDSGTLAVGNAGNIDLDWTIASASDCTAGNPVEWLSVTPAAGTTPPDSAVPVEVTVSAEALTSGLYEGVLCIAGNAPGASQTEVPVSLSVTAPDLYFEPSAVDFGDVAIGTDGATLTVILQNPGDGDATDLDFLVPAGFGADTSGCETALPAGEECEIAVSFTPAEPGPVTGVLIAGSAEGAVAELSLSGDGVELVDAIFADRFEP